MIFYSTVHGELSQMRDNEIIDQLFSFNRPQVIGGEKKLDGAAADPTNANSTNDIAVDKECSINSLVID